MSKFIAPILNSNTLRLAQVLMWKTQWIKSDVYNFERGAFAHILTSLLLFTRFPQWFTVTRAPAHIS